MSRDIQPDPTAIGRALPPPYVRLPDPGTIFRDRARRFEALAPGHELGPYLQLLGAVCTAQDAIQDGLPEPVMPRADHLARAREAAMPPLDRSAFVVDAVVAETLDRLFDALSPVAMPVQAAEALRRVATAGPQARAIIVSDILASAIPVESMAAHAFVAAGLQVHFARLAARLDAKALAHVADGVCPACGGPPVSSLVVGWPGAENARYCACPLCGTLWNHVRVKCTICSSTAGIGYRQIDGSDGTVKAECCETCGSYVKIFYQRDNASLDPVADDVASLGLDMLMRGEPYRRAGFNPFLLGA